MGAYNVKPSSSSTTNEDSKETTAGTEQQPGNEDTKKEKNHDDNGSVEYKKGNDIKRLQDKEEYHEHREIDKELPEERNEEVQAVKSPSTHKKESSGDIQEEKVKKKTEKRNTDETVMAARERYLARKRMKLEATK